MLRVGVGQKIGSERWSGSDRSKLGSGADRIGRVIVGQIGSIEMQGSDRKQTLGRTSKRESHADQMARRDRIGIREEIS